MGRKSRAFRKKVRVFLNRELASYYGVKCSVVSSLVRGIDLYTVDGAVDAIRKMDKLFYNVVLGGMDSGSNLSGV